MTENRWVGIDPGSNGGISVLEADGLLRICRLSKHTEQEIARFFQTFVLRDLESVIYYVGIEKVHAMPQQGVSSTFKFGRAYGFLRGLIVAGCLPFDEIPPSKWQQGLSIPKRKKTETQTQWKKRLQAEAHRLFPPFSSEIGREEADSVLVAAYLRKIYP